jgi:translation initiation factor 2 subunit 1
MSLHCRFYESKYPALNEVVKVTVTNIEAMGAYVTLLEYDNIEGMILMSELSRRRIRSINKLIRRGKTEVVVVIRTDHEKGYIDLSKRRATSDDVRLCEEKFSNAKTVNQILRHTAELLHFTNEQLEELYQKTAWHFDRVSNRPGASFEVLKKIVLNPDLLDECGLDEEIKKTLHTEIKRRLMPQAVKIRADFDVSCFGFEGIDAIKRAIRAGLAHSTEELPIEVHLIAPPTFYMTTQTMDRTAGIEGMTKALDSISNAIVKEDGKFTLIYAPKVVSDNEMRELRSRMAELEEANREVSGDESHSSEGSSDEDSNEDAEDAGGDSSSVKPPPPNGTV